MGINIRRGLIAAAVGVADEYAADMDANVTPARTESFKTAQDLGRLVVVAAGYGLQAFMPRYGGLGDTLATAGMPLFTKSIYRTVVAMRATAPAAGKYTPRERKQPRGSDAPRSAASRWPAPVYQNEFANIRAI